ncbi:MAG: hypothetical protein JNK19_12220 [Tabrizicola sp.]|nr:hypothetical protein [Tabrizicola sp.]
MPLCGAADRLPPWQLESLGGAEGAVVAARRAWAATCEDIRRNRPELLVLSCEHIVLQTNGIQKARLAELLSPLSSDVTPVIYVRHPVDHYRSRLQQSIKHRDRHFPPVGLKLPEAIHDSEAAFGRSPELVAFDRKVMYGGDVVYDFATRFLAPWVNPADLPSLNSNVGLSAEALVLLIRLRAEAGGTYEASRRVARLIPVLERLDMSDPPSQPLTLLPEVAEAALRCSVGYRWLAETGRLRIPGLDLDKIDGAPVPDWMKAAPPESLFFHDPQRLDRLRSALEKRQSDSGSGTPLRNSSVVPMPSPVNRLSRYILRKLMPIVNRKNG